MAVSTIDPNGLNIGQIGGRRNLIQNSDFSIAQRGTSSSLASGAINYAADRWYAYAGAIDQLTATLSQDTDAPEGFGYSAKITTGTPETTVDSNEYVSYTQKIEGYNLQSLAYGTAGAKQTVLSFWVKSSITGTFAINFYQADGAYLIGSTYTINSASTWEYKQIVISGNTLGSIANDNTEGLRLTFFIAAGSDYTSTDSTSWGAYSDAKWAYGHVQNGVVTTAGATWQITGVQFEIGDVATPHEHISYGEQLTLCQRYFCKNGSATYHNYAFQYNPSYKMVQIQYPVQMRATPTANYTMNSGSWTSYETDNVQWKAYGASTYTDISSYPLTSYSFDAEL